MKEALMVIASRYSEQQMMKAQDIIGDLRDELKEIGESKLGIECDRVFDILSDTINLDA